MAPDKIYVKEFDEGMSYLWSLVKLPKTTANAQHEYIRKDALLEWAKKQLESWGECINKVRDIQGLEKSFEFYSGAKEQTELLIDKLNSM